MTGFIRRVKRFVGVRISQCKLIRDDISLKILYRAATGEKLDLDSPTTFNEKLQWLKLNDRDPRYQAMVDKIEAKKWAASIIGEEYIIPTLEVWDSADEISLDGLPERFVLKTNHDSGTVYICKDKREFDLDKARTGLKKSLRRNFYFQSREWPYRNIAPKVFAEEFISDAEQADPESPSCDDKGIVDYKFLCYGGVCRYIFTCTGRARDDLRVDFFDLEWQHLPFERHYPNADTPPAKPDRLEEMISIAEKLSAGIPFVRVDLYQSHGRIYFGEMTFYPGAGLEEFSSHEWDVALGEPIRILRGAVGEEQG